MEMQPEMVEKLPMKEAFNYYPMGLQKWCYSPLVWRREYPHVKELGHPISHDLQKLP